MSKEEKLDDEFVEILNEDLDGERTLFDPGDEQDVKISGRNDDIFGAPFEHPTEDQWKEVFKIADQVYSLAPWDFMEEDEVFGVEDPNTNNIVYFSVMGALGEHFAVAGYVGDNMLIRHLKNTASDEDLSIEDVFNVAHLQLSFEAPAELDSDEYVRQFGGKEKYDRHGIGYSVRSFKPSYLPWLVSKNELEIFQRVLDGFLKIAKKRKGDPFIELVRMPEEDAFELLVLKKTRGKSPYWRRTFRSPDPSGAIIPLEYPSRETLLRAMETPVAQGLSMELDLFLAPFEIGGIEERHYFTRLGLGVDVKTGIVLAYEVFENLGSPEKNTKHLPEFIFQILTSSNRIPERVIVRNRSFVDTLIPYAHLLGFDLVTTETLEGVDMAMESMIEHFGMQ